MNTPALPAYLQNRQSQGVAARATSGMGGVLPPHISRAGNSFTLIDVSGNKMPIGPVMRACVVDICDVMQKAYYETDWMQGSDQPPDCYSRNGITPSQDAQNKQSQTCAQCEWNRRGSDTSKISGKPIKACRDQKEAALLLPQYLHVLFQLVIPPGSFKNWAAFSEPFKKGGTDISDVLIEITFEAGSNGVMTFRAVAYIDEAVFGAREQALTSKSTDALVGRNDVPIAITHQPNQQASVTTQGPGATAVPGAFHAGAVYNQQGQPVQIRDDQYIDTQGNVQQKPNAQFGAAPQAQVPFGAPAAAMNTQPQGNAQPAATPQTEPQRRQRRTRAQIAADNAAVAAAQAGQVTPPGQPAHEQPQVPFPVQQNPQTGFTPPAAGFGGAPAQVPFGAGIAAPSATGAAFTAGGALPATNQAHPQQTPSNPGSFGIQNGADPNADPALAAMLASIGQ